MLWPIKKTKKRSRRLREQQRQHRRRLTMESLETRRVLDGSVDLVVEADGDLKITGDDLPNQIQIQWTGADGVYKVSSVLPGGGAAGTGDTMITNNGGSPAFEQTVSGVDGNIVVALKGGNDEFTFTHVEDSPSTRSIVPQNLIINNGADYNQNHVNNVDVMRSLWVSKEAGIGTAAKHDLTIRNVKVIGETGVDNVSAPGGGGGGAGVGGPSDIKVIDSELQGVNLPDPADRATTANMLGFGLAVRNAEGVDNLNILGTTTIGNGLTYFPGLDPTVFAPFDGGVRNLSVLVINGDGGSLFNSGPDPNGSSNTNVNLKGGVIIVNGNNDNLVQDMVSLHQTNIDSALVIEHAGGAGGTNTMITSSNIGTDPVTPNGVTLPVIGTIGLVSPLVVTADRGPDTFSMSGSSAQWGAFLNFDDAGGGLGSGKSETTFTNTQIGHRVGGPASALSMTLWGPFTTIGTIMTDGDALFVGGGTGTDKVTVKNDVSMPGDPTTIGGFAEFILPAGVNTVTLQGASATAPLNIPVLLYVSAGSGVIDSGADSLLLENVRISQQIDVKMGAGSDTLELKGNTQLLALPLAIDLDGEGGDDTLIVGDAVNPQTFPNSNFEQIL